MTNELEQVINIAKKAGAEIMKYYNQEYEIKDKSDEDPSENGYDPVTVADLESNKIIVDGLRDFGYGILSEEKKDSEERLANDKVWIIDPMDGTSDFIDKTGEFTVMIGLVQNKAPVMGVVYNPPNDTVYYAVKNKGAFKKVGSNEPEKISVSDYKDNNQVRMLTSRFHLGDKEIKLFDELCFKERITCGSAGLKIARIASGEAEINMNASSKTKEWDICAADIILTEAGGCLTDMQGSHFEYNKKDTANQLGYVATNKHIHDLVIKEL